MGVLSCYTHGGGIAIAMLLQCNHYAFTLQSLCFCGGQCTARQGCRAYFSSPMLVCGTVSRHSNEDNQSKSLFVFRYWCKGMDTLLHRV